MSKAELIIGALDLSPFLAKAPTKNANSCGLRGLSLEMEQAVFYMIQTKYDSYTEQLIHGKSQVYCSWLNEGIKVSSYRYDSDGRLRFRYTQIKRGALSYAVLFLLNLDNEWWQPTQPKRKALTKNRMKTMF